MAWTAKDANAVKDVFASPRIHTVIGKFLKTKIDLPGQKSIGFSDIFKSQR